jgi:predicted transcriptional regulator
LSTALDLAVEPPLLLRPDMRIGDVLSKMRSLKVINAPVVDDNNILLGILSYKTILLKGAGRDTKVRSVMDPPYSLNRGVDFDNVIAAFVNWRLREIPVTDENDAVVGFLSRSLILDYMLKNNLLPKVLVEDVMSRPPITIEEGESIARARWLMLRNGITRLVVVDKYGRVSGVIALSDIIERLYMIRLTRRRGFKWVESEESFLAAPVSEYMTSPPIVIVTGTSLEKAVKILLDNKISGAPIVNGSEKPLGVLSSFDALKAYVSQLKLIQPVQAKVSEVLRDETSKLQIERLVNSYISKISRYVNIIDFKMSVKEETKAEKEGRKRYNVMIKIVTNMGAINSQSVCWDLPTCVREALETVEKRLRKEIEKRVYVRRRGEKAEES